MGYLHPKLSHLFKIIPISILVKKLNGVDMQIFHIHPTMLKLFFLYKILNFKNKFKFKFIKNKYIFINN